jgi:phosphoglycolate phosphatase
VIAAAYGYCDAPAHQLGADGVIDLFADLIPALTALAPTA